MVVNSDRFTKHYYAGGQRIASKIGAGEFNNLYDASKACVTAGQKDYAERLNLITQSRNDYYAALGIPPGPPTAKGIYGEAEYSGAYGDYSLEPLGNYDVPSGWPMKPYKRPYGGTPGPPVMYEKPSDPEDEGAGYGYSNDMSQQERDVFYYHSDHLGSTSYITDRDGKASQFVCYKPYGKALVDEHATSFESPWKFNGKELDSETGLYYYGARYYEPVSAMWYGVDALAEKYPNMGGYVYCAGNPVKFVDVDGKKIKFAESSTEDFKKAYNTAVKTLKDKNVDRGLLEIIKSDKTYYITETKDLQSSFNSADQTIYWNPNLEVECENGYVLTSAEILNHEGGHGAEYDKTLKKAEAAYNKKWNDSHDKDKADKAFYDTWRVYLEANKKDSNNPYGSKEEERNITDIEQYTAKKFGMEKDKVTRINHGGRAYIKTDAKNKE